MTPFGDGTGPLTEVRGCGMKSRKCEQRSRGGKWKQQLLKEKEINEQPIQTKLIIGQFRPIPNQL